MNCPTLHSWPGGERNLRVSLREGLFHAGGEQLVAQGEDGAQKEHAHQSKQHMMGTSLVAETLPSMQGVWV